MSIPRYQNGSGESDYSEFLQFELPGLEGYDFDTFEMPSLPSLEGLPKFEVPSSQAAVQSPAISPQQSSPRSQPRRASIVTVRRRSSDRPNEANFCVTLEDANGRTRSWDVILDSAYEAWLNDVSVEQVSVLTPSQIAPSAAHFTAPAKYQLNKQPSLPQFQTLLDPINAPKPTIPDAQRISDMSSSVPMTDPSYQHFAVPDIQIGQQSFAPLQPQMAATLSRPTMPIPRRVNRVPVSAQSSQRWAQHPRGILERRRARKNPKPSQPGFQRQGLGARPPLPDDIALFVNPHHLPHKHGRVPDKRGNKDTTIANDFYYTVSKLDDLELPTCGETVSYNGVEFDASLHFTSEEFVEYLRCASQRRNRHPILRIQIQPAQYNHRYIRAGLSFKCRFADCPDRRGTILKGQARVCISEFDDQNGDWLNPFHNAGYVHLFCLEQQVNFIELCDHPSVTVKPETRTLAHEPPAKANIRMNNPMALNDVETAVVDDWLTEIGNRWDAFKLTYPDPAVRPTFELAQEDTLTYRLTKTHTDYRALRNIQKKRKLEAGGRLTAHLDEFVGDVGMQVALQKKMKKQPPRNVSAGRTFQQTSSPEPPTKRQRVTTPPHPAMLDIEAHTQPGFPDIVNEYTQYSQGYHNPLDPYYPLPKAHGLSSQASHEAPGAYIPNLVVDGLEFLPPAPTPLIVNNVSQRRPSRAAVIITSPSYRGHRPSPTLIVLSPGEARRQPSAARRTSSDARLEAELLAYLERAGADTDGQGHSLFGDDGGRFEEIG